MHKLHKPLFTGSPSGLRHMHNRKESLLHATPPELSLLGKEKRISRDSVRRENQARLSVLNSSICEQENRYILNYRK
jgi:hypothetical protein